MRLIMSVMIFSLCQLVVGCATIVTGGGYQNLHIDSHPSGAEVYRRGVRVGKTPCSIQLSLQREPQLILRKEGYKEKRIALGRSFNFWILGNILILVPIVGSIIDIATGAVWWIDPDEIKVEMDSLPEKKEGEKIK